MPEIPFHVVHNKARLKALKDYLILDTFPEKDFDDITKLASQICNAPISLISLIDESRQWIKSNHGLEDNETPLDRSFCVHSLLQPDKVMIVKDARADTLFKDYPNVTGNPKIVFYAGAPLINEDGFFLGTLCIIDRVPRNLNNEQLSALKTLANVVVKLMGMRKSTIDAEEKNALNSQTINLLDESKRIARLGGWSVDLATKEVYWSSMVKEIFELPQDFIPKFGDSIHFFKPGIHRDNITALLNDAYTNGNAFNADLEIITAKGKTVWARAKGEAIMKDGKPVRVFGTFQDINEEKIKDIKLRQSELQFRETFNNASNGMALVSPDGQWLKVNKSLCNILGYTEEELLQLNFRDVTHPDDVSTDIQKRIDMLHNKIKTYEFEKRYIHKNGSIVWAILSVSLVRDINNEPLYFISQITNITLRKIAEQKVAEERRLLTTVIDNMPVNVFMKDLQYRKTMVNNNEVAYLQAKSKEDVLGKTDFDFYPEESATVSTQEDEEVFSGAEIIHRETYNKRRDGSEHWFLTSKIPLKNGEGKITGLLGISHDITEHKNNQRMLQDMVDVTTEQNNRLINFAHIVSHNLRSHATNIAMSIDLLNIAENDKEKVELMDLLYKASLNLITTIDNLNEVVAVDTNIKKETTPVLLNKAIAVIQNSIKAQMVESRVQVINKVGKDVIVDVIPAYLDSILLNFLTNAIKYRSEERKAFVKLTSSDENSFVILSIEDNGIGINMKKHGDKLFGMYKTFHGNEDARGIGLFITKNQVVSMGGKIEVESEAGKGTTFKIYLPQKTDQQKALLAATAHTF